MAGISVGGVCGYVENNSTISSCSNTGDVQENTFGTYLKGSTCGGIAGDLLRDSTICKSYNTGNIEAPSYGAGGIAGNVGESSIENCYNSGNIKSKRGIIGGICNMSSAKSVSIVSCYNIGVVKKDESGDLESGGVASVRDSENSINISNCYYLSGTYAGGINGADTDGTVKKKQEEMTTQEFVDSLNSGSKEKPWVKGKVYPILSWQN